MLDPADKIRAFAMYFHHLRTKDGWTFDIKSNTRDHPCVDIYLYHNHTQRNLGWCWINRGADMPYCAHWEDEHLEEKTVEELIEKLAARFSAMVEVL